MTALVLPSGEILVITLSPFFSTSVELDPGADAVLDDGSLFSIPATESSPPVFLTVLLPSGVMVMIDVVSPSGEISVIVLVPFLEILVVLDAWDVDVLDAGSLLSMETLASSPQVAGHICLVICFPLG